MGTPGGSHCGGGNGIGGGGAGTFASVRIVNASTSRAFILTRLAGLIVGGGTIAVYVDGAFGAGNTGVALMDPRFRAGASSFLPVADVSTIAQNAAVALPAVGTRVVVVGVGPSNSGDLLHFPYIMPPQNVLDIFNTTANQDIAIALEGYLVPTTDLT